MFARSLRLTVASSNRRLLQTSASSKAAAAAAYRQRVPSVNETIFDMCQSGAVDQALKVFNEYHEKLAEPPKDLSEYDPVTHSKVKPEDKDQIDCLTYKMLIYACLKVDKLEEALDLLRVMMDNKMLPDFVLCSGIIGGVLKREELSFAFQLLRMFRSLDLPVKQLYKLIMERYSHAGDADKAMEVYKEMKSCKINPSLDTYNALIFALTSAKRVDEALNMFEKMLDLKKVSPDATTYNLIISGCVEVGNMEEAKELFEIMKEQELPLDSLVYNVLLDGVCRKIEKSEEISTLLEDMETNKVEPDELTYDLAIKGYSKVHDIEKALEMWEKTREAGNLPTGKASTPLLNALLRSGNRQMALKIESQIAAHQRKRAQMQQRLMEYAKNKMTADTNENEEPVSEAEQQ
jgi:pentatricopeptide repeat protein